MRKNKVISQIRHKFNSWNILYLTFSFPLAILEHITLDFMVLIFDPTLCFSYFNGILIIKYLHLFSYLKK